MYERFFGLVDAPFRLTPDPRYLFLSPKHAEALAHLRLGLTESSGFVCITGDIGTGKTTLLRAFLGELGPEVSTAYLFNPAVSTLELLRRVNKELGLPAASASQSELVDALHAHLLAQRKRGGLSVVVIDEAQSFSAELLEQLRLLSNLETATEKLLRVILVGQPQLRNLLLDPDLAQLNQRITLRWHMGPLSFDETVAYIRHRLSVARAGKPPRIFTGPALRLLHRLSGGVPRLINMIAHRAMLAAFVVRRRRVTTRSIVRAYREIGAVPLPRTASPVRRLAVAATAVAAVAIGVVTLGVPQFGWLPATWRDTLAHLRVPKATRAAAPASPVAAVPAYDTAPTESATSTAAPAPALATVATVPDPIAPAASTMPAAEVERRLAALEPQASARSAVEAVLAAWRTRPLAADETRFPADLDRIAWRRGMDDLPLNGNLSMLRLLDLPAVLELHVDDGGLRYAALGGIDGGRIALSIGGDPVTVDATFLDQYWFGQAHVLWRDFEGLGPTFGQEGRGTSVARLQTLLARTGLYQGAPNGQFDPATASAVLDFQRSRRLLVDGRVGRLTRIVLYAAAGGYPRPTLATPTGGTS